MATTRHDDSDGSEIFWPGYVDATTNLILNLLFLLTILIVAVFMFALELGRSTQLQSAQEVEVTEKAEINLAAKVDFATEMASAENDKRKDSGLPLDDQELVEENIALKREVERLNTLLEKRASDQQAGGGVVRTLEATVNAPKPLTGLDRALANEAEVIVQFKDDAVEFSPEERARLMETLQPMILKGEAAIYVEVPPGFSEAKRLGYYRAMAVRNLLIELDVPGTKIDVAVLESASQPDAALVRVR